MDVQEQAKLIYGVLMGDRRNKVEIGRNMEEASGVPVMFLLFFEVMVYCCVHFLIMFLIPSCTKLMQPTMN